MAELSHGYTVTFAMRPHHPLQVAKAASGDKRQGFFSMVSGCDSAKEAYAEVLEVTLEEHSIEAQELGLATCITEEHLALHSLTACFGNEISPAEVLS